MWSSGLQGMVLNTWWSGEQNTKKSVRMALILQTFLKSMRGSPMK